MPVVHLTADKTPGPHERALVRPEGKEIALFYVEGRVYAIDNKCPHAGSSLCNGKLDGFVVQCPAHGMRFDLRTGEMPGNPGMHVRSYAVRAEGKDCSLELPDEG